MKGNSLQEKNWESLPALLSVRQFQELTGFGRVRCYELCNSKNFPALRIGRTIRINRDGLRRWIEQQTGGQALPGGWREEA